MLKSIYEKQSEHIRISDQVLCLENRTTSRRAADWCVWHIRDVTEATLSTQTTGQQLVHSTSLVKELHLPDSGGHLFRPV